MLTQSTFGDLTLIRSSKAVLTIARELPATGTFCCTHSRVHGCTSSGLVMALSNTLSSRRPSVSRPSGRT